MSDVRCLSLRDLRDALELSRLAGWNQTEADWRRLLALSPDGCFCLEESGRVVATTTLVAYSFTCGWIGMVLTHPDKRGRGYARALVSHTLAFARSRGISSIKLDATSQGQHLYESFGFTPEQIVERWERPGPSAIAETLQRYSVTLDEAAYGYSRQALLESIDILGTRSDDVHGYALTRPGTIHSYVGPCVAEDPAMASQSLSPLLNALPESGWFWDLLVENENATALASSFGFKPVRRLIRMSVGPQLREQKQNIYALAGLEFG